MRQPRLAHRKTQTLIAATQTKIELGYYHNHLVELALFPSSKMIMAKKGYNIPIKTKIPLIQIFSLCSSFIISRFLRFVNMLSKILFNHLPGGRKKPPLCKGRWHAKRDGRIVKETITKEQSLSRLRRQLPLHKGAFFMLIYAVSIFLTSTAFVDTKATPHVTVLF